MEKNKIREEGIELARIFVKEVLINEKWFNELHEKNVFDILLLTGSVVQGGKDKLSDLDFFLLMPLEMQKKYNLKPVYEYDFNGIGVEISNVTTEKLISDQLTKNHIYWWKDSVIILGDIDKFGPIIKRSGSYSQNEKNEKLWTLMALFEMNIIDMERIVNRDDHISFELNFWDCIKIFSEFMLLLKDTQKRFKWYGKLIKQFYPDVNDELEFVIKERNFNKRLSKLKELSKYFQKYLIENGFSKEEVEHWHNNNLTLLLFQRF